MSKQFEAKIRGTESEHDCSCEFMCLYDKDCYKVHAEIRTARMKYLGIRARLEERGITFEEIAKLWGMIITEELREILGTLVARAPSGGCSPICVEEGGCYGCNTFGNMSYEYVLMWSLFGQLLVWIDETNAFWKALRAGPRSMITGSLQGTISRAVSFPGVEYGKGRARVDLDTCLRSLRLKSDGEVRAVLAPVPCQWALNGWICQKGALGCCLNAHPEDHPQCIERGVIELALKN